MGNQLFCGECLHWERDREFCSYFKIRTSAVEHRGCEKRVLVHIKKEGSSMSNTEVYYCDHCNHYSTFPGHVMISGNWLHQCPKCLKFPIKKVALGSNRKNRDTQEMPIVTTEPGAQFCCDNPNVVENVAGGVWFKVCKNCKREV